MSVTDDENIVMPEFKHPVGEHFPYYDDTGESIIETEPRSER